MPYSPLNHFSSLHSHKASLSSSIKRARDDIGLFLPQTSSSHASGRANGVPAMVSRCEGKCRASIAMSVILPDKAEFASTPTISETEIQPPKSNAKKFLRTFDFHKNVPHVLFSSHLSPTKTKIETKKRKRMILHIS